MESIWSKHTNIPNREPLTQDIQTQAAVIGGGLTGILTAFHLQKRGIRAVILEADRIGGGQTKNTTAKITAQHGLIYGKLKETFGQEKARQYAQANQTAITAYRDMITENQIDCAFKEAPAYLYTVNHPRILEQEAAAAQSLGINAAFTQKTELPFPITGAVKFEQQAQFDPLAFLKAVSENLSVFENTRVKTVQGNLIQTDKGVIQAKHIVFACHYPFINMPGYYFMRMHQQRSYVTALKNAPLPEGMYLGIDPENAWSLRSAGDFLLLGGGSHRTGENRQGGRYKILRQKAAEFFPGSVPAAQWSAQDCIPLDNVPYIGRFSADTPNWYVATGFQKWGMTTAMAAAMLLADQITNGSSPYEAVFSPQRFTPAASAGNFLKEGMHAVKDLSRQFFAPPRAKIDALPPGHGGIVEYDGKKTGVYKTENGETTIVSTRCPHLGCQVEWNPDEKSWDCPCHGSRFDCKGNLIDNPAQEGLIHEAF